MSVAHELAESISGLSYSDIPERVRELTRAQVASVLGAIFASRFSDDAARVERAVRGWAAPGNVTCLPSGQRLGLREAVLVSSAHSMALDYDDYLYMGHTGHSAVLAALALGEAEGHAPEDVLTAMVLANEVGGRVGASAVLGPQNGQAWSFIHAVEAAVVAAKLWRLDREQTAHAIAIALYQPTFTLWPGFMGPGSKVLTAAGPTLAGLDAAAFAREGLTGAAEIFEHPRKGFWANFSWVPLPSMLRGLGRVWLSDTLAFKRYAGCAYVDTTLDALFEVLAQFRARHLRSLEPDEVRRVQVTASLLTVEMDNLSSEHREERLSAVNVNFSVPLNVAIAIVFGAHEGETFASERLTAESSRIAELAARVDLVHDWAMTLEVVRAFDGLGSVSVARQLGPRDAFDVLAGYRRELGGPKKTPVRASGLLGQWRTLGKMLRASARRRPTNRQDLSDFRMAFPAEVRLETRNGEVFRARQDVPWGAPGDPGRAEVAYQKLRREARHVLTLERVEELVRRVRHFEAAPVAALVESARPG